MSTNKFINSAKKTIEIQADSIASLINQIDKSFAEIGKKVSLLRGKLIVMGVGKSGHVGQKVSATLASTCLLYTSPSPRDGLLSRMPSSA